MTERTFHDVTQGSPEWHALRARHFTASEAAAMMGVSPYETRGALLRRKATGIAADVDAATQRRFDDGHAAEAAYRPIAEQEIGDDLYPATITADIDGLPLLASMDGLTMDGTIGFEHKLYNAETARIIDETGEPPIHHVWQLEHQMLVSGAEKILFVTSDGTQDMAASCWYESKPERRKALIEGWRQFQHDLNDPETLSALAATPAPQPKATIEGFGTLVLRVEGRVLASNLDAFRAGADAFLARLPKPSDLKDDQDFAEAEAAAKACSEAESRIKAAKEQVIAQMADVEAVLRTADHVAETIRQARLALEKAIKTRKEQIKADIIAAGQSDLARHVQRLQERVGMALPREALAADFAGAIKGLRSVDSIKNAVHQEVTRAKLAANEIADRMELNIKSLAGESHDWRFLFPDLANVAHKPAEDFANLLAARIADWNAREEQRRQREAEAAAKAAQVVQQAAATVAAQPMTTKPVVADEPAKVIDNGATLKLGDINARIAPLAITADGLASIGFEPVGKEGAAKLYRASDFPRICAALIDVLRIAAREAEQA